MRALNMSKGKELIIEVITEDRLLFSLEEIGTEIFVLEDSSDLRNILKLDKFVRVESCKIIDFPCDRVIGGYSTINGHVPVVFSNEYEDIEGKNHAHYKEKYSSAVQKYCKLCPPTIENPDFVKGGWR